MRAVGLVFAVGWGTFWLYWLVAAFSTKRGRVPWSRELRIRTVIVVVVIVLIRLGAFRGHAHNTDPWRAGIGLVLFALGLGFAVWARVHIGRNWGTPMAQKDEPELVTSGPYRSESSLVPGTRPVSSADHSSALGSALTGFLPTCGYGHLRQRGPTVPQGGRRRQVAPA